MKMWILGRWNIICQGLKHLNIQLCFNFSYKSLGLNIFVLVNFFLSKWFTGMSNSYLIQNLFLNWIYMIFQGIQFFFKILLLTFHFIFQHRQLIFHNFTFFENPDKKAIQLAEITCDANVIIIDRMSLKNLPMVSLDLLFLNKQVSSNAHIEGGDGGNFPTMCWFLDYFG